MVGAFWLTNKPFERNESTWLGGLAWGIWWINREATVVKSETPKHRQAASTRLKSPKQKAAGQRFRRREQDAFGTRSALERAATMDFDEWRMPEVKALDIPVTPRRFATRGVLEEHARIDIRHLHLPLAFPIDTVVERPLAFGAVECRKVLVAVEECGGHLEAARIRFYDGDLMEQYVQIIIKEIGGRSRPFFKCPIDRTAVEVLAYREGLFASAKAQSLINRSQVGANRKRGSKGKTLKVKKA